MRAKHFLMAGMAVVLTACGPMVVYDQPGVSVSRLASDLQRCEAEAYAKAPPNITRERMTVQVTEYRYGIPRTAYDRQWVDIDRNEIIRGETRVACLQTAGYQLAQIPRCSLVSGADITPQTRQAPAGPGSCAVSVSGVGPVIVAGE